MPVRTSTAQWNDTLTEGNGTMAVGSGAYEGQYSFGTRFEEGVGSNPEELIAAAHAGCFSMALAGNITRAGGSPEQVNTEARVRVDKVGDGFGITGIELTSRVHASGLDEAQFQEVAEQTRVGCPVSQALKAVDITLDARLES